MKPAPVKFEDWPIRQKSANGEPKPKTSIERTCRRCGAAFIGLAVGRTGKRGIWQNHRWFCSQECFDDRNSPLR